MTVLPLIARELRAEARRPWNYWMRILASAVVMTVFFSASASSALGGIALGNSGAALFRQAGAVLYGGIWLVVPLLPQFGKTRRHPGLAVSHDVDRAGNCGCQRVGSLVARGQFSPRSLARADDSTADRRSDNGSSALGAFCGFGGHPARLDRRIGRFSVYAGMGQGCPPDGDLNSGPAVGTSVNAQKFSRDEDHWNDSHHDRGNGLDRAFAVAPARVVCHGDADSAAAAAGRVFG